MKLQLGAQVINMGITQQQYDRYQEIVTDILKLAKKHGADAADVAASISTGLSVNVRNQEIDTVEFDNGKGMGITVYFGKHKGSASTSDLSIQSLEDTVAKACSLAKIMAEDKYCGLADSELMAYDYPELELLHPWGINADEARQVAIDCEKAGLDFNKKITNSEGTHVGTMECLSIYGNSHGFIGGYKSSRHSISCVLIASQEDKMQRDYWYSTARRHEDLDNIKIIGEKAAARTVARLNPRKVKTQKAPVLFAPEMARGILSSFVSAISGGNLYRESSFLLNKLGEKVFSDLITITENPFLENGLGSAAFDSEGVRTKQRTLVENGILNGYVLGSYSARRLGMTTTGNAGGVHNLLITPGDNTQEQLIKNIDKGLLVTELMGQGINIVTGDYSRGASGYWIENGEIKYPVEGATIAGNLKDIFNNITAVGNDIDKRGNIQTGSLLVDSMMIAGE
jgi:PmbA protein